MYSRTAQVINKSGLHARPAAAFVVETGKFSSNISVEKINDSDESGPVDAKSIIKILSLMISYGDEIEISATGNDEKEAVDALVGLIESGCKE